MSGNVFLIAGPSGVGKGTVVKELLKLDQKLWVSISATTRTPRDGELDGVNYHFITQEKFQEMIDSDGFLEYARYVGNGYGTPKQQLVEKTAAGYDAILEIEVQGCKQVKQKMPEVKGIFILPPGVGELERRLRGRGSESEDKIRQRLDTAKIEMSQISDFDFFVVNDNVSDTAKKILAIIRGYRQKD